jgi:hypothetical protein
MDYLDYELMRYQEEQEAYCDICGEYSTEDWQCDCCRECEKSSCECSDEYEDILGV